MIQNAKSPAPIACPPVPSSCPACRGLLSDQHTGSLCLSCARLFPNIAGLPDLRLASDRYLDLPSERAKAARLAAFEPTSDALSLAAHYYDMTDDVDARRRARFLAHIAAAEVRGEALSALLPSRGPILEVGTGTAGLVASALRSGRSIVGSDIATRWLLVGRRRLTDLGLEAPLIGAEAARLPWPDNAFECVVADSVLEHLDNPSLALREWLRVLRPGGQLTIWSPNRHSLGTDPHVGLWGLGFMPRSLIPSYVQLRRGIPWMVNPLSPSQAARLAHQAGWTDVRVSSVDIPERWARTRLQHHALQFYSAFNRLSLGRLLTTHFGPLWQLRATKRTTP
jgi:ubiquinone/menaquinone biosynthesis C-methylase UbiE